MRNTQSLLVTHPAIARPGSVAKTESLVTPQKAIASKPVTKTENLVTHQAAQPPGSVTITSRYGEPIDAAFLMGKALKAIEAVVKEYDRLCHEIYWLEQCPRINAKPYWRQGRYLYLIYPQVAGERERRYIGCNKEDIDRVLKAIENHCKQEALKARAADIQRELQRWIDQLGVLEFTASGLSKEYGDSKQLLEPGRCHHEQA